MASEDHEEHEEDETIKYAGVRAMPFVIGNETFERLGTIGTSSNLLVYLTTVFNMKSITATNVMNIFNGTINLATLVGAFLCDSYFGRYKTLGFACVSSFLEIINNTAPGMLVITLTAAIPKLHPPHCRTNELKNCSGPTLWQMLFLIFGFGFLVIGGGGIRPCNLAFGADQFNPNTASGKRGISSFFNWYYFTLTFAVMVSLTAIVYIQSDVSWAWGLAIPTFLMSVSCFLYFLGSRIYVKVKPDGSALIGVVQVVIASIRKRRLDLPSDPCLGLFEHIRKNSINSKLSRTNQFRCLENAAIITPDDKFNEDGSAASSWMLCSIQQVEEVKCLVRVLPICTTAIIYYIVLVQQQTYTVFQALQMDRRLGPSFKIPAASYNLFSMLALTVWIPFYDRIIVPALRKITRKEGGITVLQKMGIGIFLAIVMMSVSGFVEGQRRSLALKNPIGNDPIRGAISSLSGLWLMPQLVIGGVSEAFTLVAQVDFFYNQFPENMRSIAASFAYVGFAVSSYLTSLLITTIHHATERTEIDWLPQDLNKGRLDYFYYMIAAIEAVNLVYFIICARWYKYKGSTEEFGIENHHTGKELNP